MYESLGDFQDMYNNLTNKYSDQTSFLAACKALQEQLDSASSETGRVVLYEYRNPVTFETFFYDRMGVYRKDGQVLMYVGKS